jgi:hypothetical protein
MAKAFHVHEGKNGHQAANVEAIGCGVEADITRHGFLQIGSKAHGISHLSHKTTLIQNIQDIFRASQVASFLTPIACTYATVTVHEPSARPSFT